MEPSLYLASRSPRRRALLEQIGVFYGIVPAAIEERRRPEETPEQFVVRMALEKARKGRENLASSSPRLVLGADTVVVVEGQVLGKPEDAKAAYHQLMQLSGRSHEVLSAVALVASPRTERLRLARSRVWFRPLDPAECNAYCATGEPLDKAGSYAIQGLAAAFIYRLEGSYSGVMGLPLFETAALLEEMGIPILPRAAERHRQE